MNLIPVKDQIRYETCYPFLGRFLSLGVGAYCIRPTNKSVRVGAYCIRPTNAYVNRQMIQPPGTCWGVCFCALPIPIKNLIPIHWMNLKPGRFWGVCLYDQSHLGEKPLKFVWMHAKPAGNWMNMAISTENPPGIGWIWPYPPKTRRGLDENGHIYRKPGGNWTNMAISIENPAGIGRKWPYSLKTRRGLDENGHIHRKPGEDWTKMAISIENPARIGRKWSYPSKTRRGLDEYGHIYRKPGGDWIQYGYSYRILAGNRISYVFGNHIFGKDGIREPTCRLYLFYIGRQMARTVVNVSRQECRATRGMRSAVCVRQSFTLRLPSLAHSPSPSYC